MLRYAIRAYRRAEDGAMTVLNLFFILVMALLGGLAIDMGNLIAARTHLQIAADTAAQAAILMRETNEKAVAKAKAIELAQLNMPNSRYGDVLREDNIYFGTWDKDTKTFTIDDDLKGAVYVKTDRLAANANPVSAFLLQFAGFTTFDVVTTSVFETYRPTCLREGFVGQDVVDIQSNNNFTNGFCVHSNTHVSVNQNNLFEEGTIVSMPDAETNIELPSSGFEQNEGLQAALRDGGYWIQIVQDLATGRVESDLKTGTDDNYTIAGLDISSVESYTPPGGNAKLEMADLHLLMDDGDAATLNDGEMHIYEIGCGANNNLTIGNDDPFENVVILTDCNIVFAQGTQLFGTTILTRSTDSDSVKSPSGLQIGLDDGCAPGGGSQVLTHGGMSQAADVSMYGGRIVGVGDVAFAAANDGIEGASVVSGGRVDMTAGSNMAFCGDGMTDTFEADYYRMAG